MPVFENQNRHPIHNTSEKTIFYTIHQEPLSRSGEDFPDLGKRYLDFIAQALAQGRTAASNGAPRTPHQDPPADYCRHGPCCSCGCGIGGGGFPPSFPDVSVRAIDAVVGRLLLHPCSTKNSHATFHFFVSPFLHYFTQSKYFPPAG